MTLFLRELRVFLIVSFLHWEMREAERAWEREEHSVIAEEQR